MSIEQVFIPSCFNVVSIMRHSNVVIVASQKFKEMPQLLDFCDVSSLGQQKMANFPYLLFWIAPVTYLQKDPRTLFGASTQFLWLEKPLTYDQFMDDSAILGSLK